jgi:hypothetical protein
VEPIEFYSRTDARSSDWVDRPAEPGFAPLPRTGSLEFPFTEVEGWDGQHLHYFTHTELAWLLGEVGITPTQTLVFGKFPAIKRLAPRYLSGSVDIVGCKV